MRLFVIYCILEWKKSIKILGKTIISLLVMGVLMIATVTAVSKILLQSQVFSKIEVAVVIPEEEELIRQSMSFIQAIDSIDSICEFSYVSFEDAMECLRNNEVQAVVELPVNFYNDIYTGRNTPATLYLPADKTLKIQLFGELLQKGVSMLQTAQAGVYATLDIAGEYRVKMDRGEIGEYISLLYIKEILGRQQYFYPTVISPTGWLSMEQYYFLSAFLLLLMMSGIYYGFLYGKQKRAVELKLRMYGMDRIRLALCRILVMTFNSFLLCLLLYSVGSLLAGRIMVNLQALSFRLLLGFLILSLALAAYFHLVYILGGGSLQGAVLMLVINFGLILVSGLLLPTAYFPDWIRKMSGLLPLTYWQGYGIQLLYGKVYLEDMLILLGIGTLMTGLGVCWKWEK